MKKLVFGSLNIDKVYRLESIVHPGETTPALSYGEFCGGKGFNQAIALARAGSRVHFAGALGPDGGPLRDKLAEARIDHSLVKQLDEVSGHALIQVEESGQNAIIVYAGANGQITRQDVDHALSAFGEGDLIVLQNEIAQVDYIIAQAHRRGMVVAFNPSPINPALRDYPIEAVDYLILNEVEGALLADTEALDQVLPALARKYPNTSFVLTLGALGAVYRGRDGQTAARGVLDVQVADTTAAGDTFCGYFLHHITEQGDPARALEVASAAGNIAVTRAGAEPSIPLCAEVERVLATARFGAAPVL